MTQKWTIDIVLPVYNEEDELADHAATLVGFLRTHFSEYICTVTIADNASTDTTLSIAKSLTKQYKEIRVLHMTEKGRGRAVKQAWMQSDAQIHCYMDIDLSTDLDHLLPLINSLMRGYDIAIGTRNSNRSRVYGRSLLRTFTSKVYIWLIKIFFMVRFSDAQCGFKAISDRSAKQLLPLIKDNAWFFDTELLIIAEKLGLRIYEEAVTWIDNPGSTVRVVKTAQGDLEGLWRLFITRPWRSLK